MKKKLFFLFFAAVIMNSLTAQEMQLSVGPAASFGVLENNTDLAFLGNYNPYIGGYEASILNQDIKSLYFAPGIDFSMRVFANTEKAFSSGFCFHTKIVFVTNLKQTGTGSLNGYSVSVSETDGFDFIIGSDIGLGYSLRYNVSEKLKLYAEYGLNFTSMDFEFPDETLSYWGMGSFVALALQVDLTKTMYLEFGLNAIYNIFSSQVGTVVIENKTIKYEDTGRWGDLISAAASIVIGWRVDLKEYGK